MIGPGLFWYNQINILKKWRCVFSKQNRVYAREGGIYHVICRTNQKIFFFTDEEKGILWTLICRAADFGGVEILTYCVMDNHLHLLIHIPEKRYVPDDELVGRIRMLYSPEKSAKVLDKWRKLEEEGCSTLLEIEREKYRKRTYNLSDFVKTFKEDYTESFNRRFNQIGTVWAGRYKSILVSDTPGLSLLIALYIDLNPVRAPIEGVEGDPGNYGWSGAAAALRGDRRAREGICMIGRRVGFAQEDSLPEKVVACYYGTLIGKIGAPFKTILEREIVIDKDDRRFCRALRDRGKITVWELIHCRCRLFTDGQAIAGDVQTLKDIKQSHPCASVLPGFCIAHPLRGVEVILP